MTFGQYEALADLCQTGRIIAIVGGFIILTQARVKPVAPISDNTAYKRGREGKP